MNEILTWLKDNWILLTLFSVSEIMSLLPVKYNSISQVIIKIIKYILNKGQ